MLSPTNITAQLVPYSNVPHQTMVSLQNWLNGYDFKSHTFVRVAQASKGEDALVFVCFVKIDDAYLITAWVINPKATEEDAHQSGDALDNLLAQYAQLEGVTKLFMLQGGNTCTEVRIYEPRITYGQALPTITRIAYSN